MGEQFKYRSVFEPYFDSFLKMKDAMGYGLNRFRWMFLELDRFFVETVWITPFFLPRVPAPD